MKRPRWIGIPRAQARIAREIDEEIAFHLSARIADLQGQGHTLVEARRMAHAEFGDVDAARAELRAYDRVSVGRDRWRIFACGVRDDFGLVLRTLWRHRTFSAVVVGILAVGVASSVAMFSLVDRLMLRAAPWVQDAGHLGHVYHTIPTPGRGDQVQVTRSYQDLISLQQATDLFSGVGAYFSTRVALGRDDALREVPALVTDDQYFHVLGVRPLLGRTFTKEEGGVPDADVVILTHGFWSQQMGADPQAIGRRLEVFGRSYTVIGVMPRGFRGTGLAPVDLILPLSVRTWWGTTPDRRWASEFTWQWLNVLVRLRDGVTATAAAARATTIFRAVHESAPFDRNVTVQLGSVLPGRAPGSTRDARVAVLLLVVSAILLLMATANVGTLLLNRAVVRRREVNVRLALGVSRGRLVRTLLMEGTLLGVGGAAIGTVLASILARSVRALLLPDADPLDAVLDARAVLVGVACASVAGIFAGLAPATILFRRDLGAGFSTAGRATAPAGRLRATLVAMQAALSVILLVGAALLGKSLWHATRVDLGFSPFGAYALFPNLAAVPAGERSAVMQAIQERLMRGRLADVAAISTTVPFWMNRQERVRSEVDTLPRFLDGAPSLTAASPEYFAALQIAIRRGRALTAADGAGSQAVAVVNETLAEALYPSAEPLGRCLYYGDAELSSCVRIVGIMANTRRYSIGDDERSAQLVLPLAQVSTPGLGALLLRTRASGADLVALTREIRRMDARIGLVSFQSLEGLVESRIRPYRVGALLLAGFGGVALLLAAFGLYTVVAYDASQRSHEIGVRLALGASPRGIVRGVLRRSLSGTALGVGAGVVAVWAASGSLAPLLFQVEPRDPATYIAATTVALVVAVAAGWRPAARASRMDPLAVLRAD